MTVRFIPILIVIAATLSAIAPVHAQDVIAVAHQTDQNVDLAGDDSLTIDGFTGGVGGTGPDASGGGAIVIQMLQQPTTGATAIAASAASSRYSAVSASH